MGMDPLTIGMGMAGLGAIGGAVTGDRANARNTRSQQQAQQAAQQQQQFINQQAGGMMQGGTNPFAQMLMSMLGGGMSGGMPRPGTGGPTSPMGGLTFNRPQEVNAYTYDPSMMGMPQSINPQMMGAGSVDLNMIPQLAAQMIQPGAIGSQGFNAGQDALSQMLRRSPGPSVTDPTLGLELQQAGQAFNNSDLFGALAPLDQRMIDQQAAQLHGSFGSLGARFGTAAMDKERQLRGDFAQNVTARNAQLQSTSFENAMQRQLGALGQRGAREQFQATLPLQQQAQQANIAQMLQSGGLQQSGLLAQLGIANQGAALQVGQANQGSTLQALLANLQAQQQTGLANQSTDLASQQSNIGNMLQAMMANQQSQNQGGQFNAGQRTQAGQFNAMQGQQWNQFMSQILGQAGGMQQGQQSQNAQLLSIMAGLPGVGGVQSQPSQMPGAFGDIGQLLMFLPFLRGMGGGGQPPINIPGYTPPPNIPSNFPTYNYP